MAAALTRRNRTTTFNLRTRFLNSPTQLGGSTRSLQTIAYEELQSHPDNPPTSTAVIIHGFLGSARNWRSFSRNLISTLSDSNPSSNWRTVMVDMRNHGRSAERGLDPPHDLENAAKDVSDLVKGEGWRWPEVVIGHSMGGKVALQFAWSCSQGEYGDSVVLPKQVWVLDSVPGAVNHQNDEVQNVLATLESLPSQIPSRKWLVSHLMGLGYSKALSDWVGTNLKKDGDHETWLFDLQAAKQMFHSYWEKSYWDLLENPPKGMEIIIVRAEKSDRWDEDTIQRIEKLASEGGSDSLGKVSLCVLPNAGHWVHVDNPKGLLEMVAPKIASL